MWPSCPCICIFSSELRMSNGDDYLPFVVRLNMVGALREPLTPPRPLTTSFLHGRPVVINDGPILLCVPPPCTGDVVGTSSD